MAYREPVKILRDIIKEEMELEDDRILIYNQKWNLPNDSDIFISLKTSGVKTISSRVTQETREDGFYEVKNISIREFITVDIFSKNNTARERKEEIIMALNSNYSQQQQEKYSIKIFGIPTNLLDISNIEASAMLNRFNTTITLFSWKTKDKKIDYFDTFDYTISTNK